MSATPMDIARSAVAHQMAGNRAWHQPAFLVMNSAVNFADQMASNAAEKGNAEMYDAYAAVTAYLSESRDRLTARYPLVNLDDLATDTPQDHGPLAAHLSDRTLDKVLSRPAYVPRKTPSLVELDRREAAAEMQSIRDQLVARALKWEATRGMTAAVFTAASDELADAVKAYLAAVAR